MMHEGHVVSEQMQIDRDAQEEPWVRRRIGSCRPGSGLV